MSDFNINMEIPNDLRTELENLGKRIARDLAMTFREELSKEYENSVQFFYNSYTPKVYDRHYQLPKSYHPYYVNVHGYRFHGGIEISPDSMQPVYHDSPSEVLSTALSGYHGRPNRGIYTAPEIYEHMMKFRDVLFDNAEAYVKL